MVFWVRFLCGVVRRPLSALGNPCPDFCDVGTWHSIAFWRHTLVRIIGHKKLKDGTLFGSASNDVGGVEFASREGGFGSVETVAGLLLFWAVALNAMFLKQRLDFGLKINRERVRAQKDFREDCSLERSELGEGAGHWDHG